MMLFAKLLDRTLVLFIGLVVGVVIGLAYAYDGKPLAILDAGTISPPAGPPAPLATPTPTRQCASTLTTTPQLIAALRADRPIHIGVFGDSFGEGLWASVYNNLLHDKSFAVHGFAKQSTGFTRYQTLDLLEDTRRKIDAQPIDIAIISFGANDTQGIWADGKIAPYMSTDWQRVIGARATAMVKLLQSRGVAVIWIGLPRMREAGYDNQITQMNSFYTRTMCALDVPFVNTLPVSVDATGHFTPYLEDPETHLPFKARAGDGIHMSMKGYSLLIQDLLHHIKGYSATPAPLRQAQ